MGAGLAALVLTPATGKGEARQVHAIPTGAKRGYRVWWN
jgi:hypothetical protein